MCAVESEVWGVHRRLLLSSLGNCTKDREGYTHARGRATEESLGLLPQPARCWKGSRGISRTRRECPGPVPINSRRLVTQVVHGYSSRTVLGCGALHEADRTEQPQQTQRRRDC